MSNPLHRWIGPLWAWITQRDRGRHGADAASERLVEFRDTVWVADETSVSLRSQQTDEVLVTLTPALQVARETQANLAPAELRPALSAMLQGLPGATGVAALSGDLYVLEFSPAIMKRLNEGTARLVRTAGGNRAIVTDGNRFIEHAVLKRPGLSQRSIVPLAAWQAVSILVAQQHLLDINRQLRELSEGITAIRRMLEQETWATLYASAEALHMLREALSHGSLNDADTVVLGTKLEQLDFELARTAAVHEMRLADAGAMLNDEQLGGMGLKEQANRICGRVSEYERHGRAYLLALCCRGIAAELRTLLPLAESMATMRRNAIRDRLVEFRAQRDEFLTQFTARAVELTSPFATAKRERALQEQIRGKLERTRQALSDVEHGIRNAIGFVESSADARARRAPPPKLLVGWNDQGELAEIRLLESTGVVA